MMGSNQTIKTFSATMGGKASLAAGMFALASLVCAGADHGVGTPPSPEMSPDARQEARTELVSLKIEPPRKLAKGVTVFLQETAEPGDRLLLGLASAELHLSDVHLELRAGEEVVFPYQRLRLTVTGGRMTLMHVTLKKKVLTTPETWRRYLSRKGGVDAVMAAGRHVPIKVTRFFAIRK